MTTQILVVDDHDVVRMGIKSIVREMRGCEVCGDAVNGKEAVEQVIQLKPDLVLMDVSMPIMGGIEAAKVINQISPATKIVMLSMHKSDQITHAATMAGIHIDGCLNKSSVRTELESTLVSLGLWQ